MIVTSCALPCGSTARAASAAGSAEAASTGTGKARRNARFISRYSVATSNAPPIMARGSVRTGSVFSSAM